MNQYQDPFSDEQMKRDYKIAFMVAPIALAVIGVFVLFLYGLNPL